MNTHSASNRRRRGVALIMVLGMIALMSILGVGFAVTMRTERMSANFYLHQIRGEHLAHTAIARATDDVASNLYNRVYPDWGLNPLGQRIQVRGSSSDGAACTTLLSPTIRSYVPSILWSQAETFAATGGVQWIAAPAGLGAYAYLIINASGLLDANHAGGDARQYGTNAAEIAIGELSEFDNENAYTLGRQFHRRYDTLPEIYHYHQTTESGGSGALNSPLSAMNIRHPVPVGRRTAAGTFAVDQVAIGGTVQELVANQNNIVAAFADAGIDNTTTLPDINLTQAQVAFYNLVDYVDDDKLPGNLGVANTSDPRIPTVEPNPMFNEVLVEYTINIVSNAAGGWSYTVSGNVKFELAWFFPQTLFSGPYTFRHHVTFSSTAPGGAFAATAPQPAQFTYNPPAVPQFGSLEADIAPVNGNLVAFPENAPFNITATIRTGTYNANNILVDTNMPLTVSLPFLFSNPAGESITLRWGLECIEPRMNYFATVGGVPNWEVTNPEFPSSIGAMNNRAQLRLSEPESDGTARFFVANRSLNTVGELGYLFYGTPWQTIRLYRHLFPGGALGEWHRVLDHFTMTTNRWQAGLVNPNTEIGWALAAALKGMPYDDDADAITPTFTLPEAMEIADAWVSDVANLGQLANLSDIGSLSNVFHNTFIADLDTEPQKEALIRNAAGLFHPRQNQFIIIVAVNTFGVAGREIGLRRLIAEIWRDPYRDPANGRHNTVLRFLQWVD